MFSLALITKVVGLSYASFFSKCEVNRGQLGVKHRCRKADSLTVQTNLLRGETKELFQYTSKPIETKVIKGDPFQIEGSPVLPVKQLLCTKLSEVNACSQRLGYSVSLVSNPAAGTSLIDLLQRAIQFGMLWMLSIANLMVLILSLTALILSLTQPPGEGKAELQTVH